MTHRYGIAATLSALLLLLAIVPVHAQFAVFISGNGSDMNDCATPNTACRTFQQAQTTVPAGGGIHVLPGDCPAVTITKSVQIIADAGQASISGSAVGIGGLLAGIFVNAGPSDVVLIRGMIVDRHGSTGGGIGFVAGGALHVENCTLVNSGGAFGIHFRPSANSELVVSNGTIANNGAGPNGGGIEVRPEAGASAKVTLHNVRVVNNNTGITVRNRSNVLVRGSTVTDNRLNGIGANGATAIIRMADSTVGGNKTGLNTANGGQIISHRGNVVANNETNGAFTSTVNQQ